MKTKHGATMSPRMERLWYYIRSVRKIRLHDHSTDRCVARVMPELRAALEEAPDVPGLKADLRAIMRRTPCARVKP